MGMQRRAGIELADRQASTSQYGREQVVEVMRDSAGENAEAVEPLCLLHPLLELAASLLRLPALGDLATHADVTVITGRVAVGQALRLEPQPPSVPVANAPLAACRPVAIS